ncbi:uncharacterized protein LOC132697632 [Cylas formicarius]|uniref:uncharacterized protein LOC132697632 n=1 Tax=Cylas formicarius TaxID=197179 RepID=UPI00295850DC|nr:uncharacterized protein LOC132697632 [Cylas formicarius]
MIVLEMGDDVIVGRIVSGQFQGRKCVIIRKQFVLEEKETPLLPGGGTFYRKQFPIKLTDAITINKAQGQTLSRVGLCLNVPCFAHGQLYVALSRVRTWQDIRIFVKESRRQGRFFKDGRKNNPVFTQNIVYRAFLDKIFN